MEPRAYDLCIELNGCCSCAANGRRACEVIIEMAFDGVSAQDERERIQRESDAAADEGF